MLPVSVDNWFAASLAHGDDINLLSAGNETYVITCDKFGDKYSVNVAFNDMKSKCLTFHHCWSLFGHCATIFFRDRRQTDLECWWVACLGHIFNVHSTDDDDILTRRTCFLGQTNSLWWNFSRPVLDPQTRTMLFKQSCSSYYSFMLWQLTNSKLEDYTVYRLTKRIA
jgi:hypothetical protein